MGGTRRKWLKRKYSRNGQTKKKGDQSGIKKKKSSIQRGGIYRAKRKGGSRGTSIQSSKSNVTEKKGAWEEEDKTKSSGAERRKGNSVAAEKHWQSMFAWRREDGGFQRKSQGKQEQAIHDLFMLKVFKGVRGRRKHNYPSKANKGLCERTHAREKKRKRDKKKGVISSESTEVKSKRRRRKRRGKRKLSSKIKRKKEEEVDVKKTSGRESSAGTGGQQGNRGKKNRL